MRGNVNKTDKLDARGLAILLRNGTLPTVWIAPSQLNQVIEQWPATGIAASGKGSGANSNHGRTDEGAYFFDSQHAALESSPGVATILPMVIGTEIGRIERFARAEQLASYAGTMLNILLRLDRE